MASAKVGLLDQLPCSLRPRIMFISGFRLVVIGGSVVLLFLIFLCGNYPSKKPYLLRSDSSSPCLISSATTSDAGIEDHTHLTNQNGVVANTSRSSDGVQILASNGTDSVAGLGSEVINSSSNGNLGGEIGNSSEIQVSLAQLAEKVVSRRGSRSRSSRCDVFDGKWVRNDTKQQQQQAYYPPGSCPHIDTDFDCFLNGRPDSGFLHWRWQPNACTFPILNATDFLERLRGKKLVFVGDSLNRNMWESLVCILRHTVRNKNKVYEISGRTEFKKMGVYAFRFEEYNCSVDFVSSPFLVRESSYRGRNGTFETLRLDLMDRTTSMYEDADILVFNTGHWWTHEKTSRGEDYYQEGNHVYPRLKVLQAYIKALTTWGRWVDDHIKTNKTLVFFRGYSVTHFRGGQWNSGGQCHKETEPILNEEYLGKYPWKMRALEQVLKGMKTPVIYLNISRMTDYRKDGHPSIYRKVYVTAQERIGAEQSQDCSHWCLPGVPDNWNELLYASLLEAEDSRVSS